MEARMRRPGAWRRKTAVLALAGVLAAAMPLAAWADTRSRPSGTRPHYSGSRGHSGYHYRSDALIGGVFGGAILGLTLGALARPYGPPQYIYVDPPPAYYVPPPVPPYPPVPVYPASDPYAAPGYYYAPAPVPPAPAPAQTAAQRLQELQDACKRGLMSKQECDAKRKAIIEGL
jgi:hypothetical protein